MHNMHVNYSLEYAESKDATRIGYRRFGSGTPVVLMHGGMMSAHNLMRLGTALADRFTVCLPDRRGRATSGPYGPHFSLQRATEDVAAVMNHTGAHNIFALSVGAIPVLQWALSASPEYRIAVYEPPLPVNGSNPTAWLPRYEQDMARGDTAAALVTIAKGTKDSRLVELLPRPLIVPVMRVALRVQARQATDADITLTDLVPTMHFDARTVLDADTLIDQTHAIRAQVLLLGGSRSPRYLTDALDALEENIPRAQRKQLRGLGHLSADNDGHPERVAAVLSDFFALPRRTTHPRPPE
ncbi:alpha/beta fold hydrolase [Nocardia tengchongensis]|uniref:alpha/beta fold hydrolase n=1 Tax=Nocardia tengchongensis TaxID=2055889 RepID=UPI00365A5453